MYEFKTEDVYEDFSKGKEVFNFNDCSEYYDDWNKLVVGKMKDETGGFGIEEFLGLKSKMHWLFVSDSSKHEKA